MAFLDNARGATDERRAATVRELITAARLAGERGEPTDLVEVTVRYSRMSMKYEEAPIVVPREAVPHLHELAMNYLHYTKLHISARVGNTGYSKFVALTPDKELLVIEVLHKNHEPEQNQDDERRAKFRGLGNPGPVDLSAFEQ